VVWFEGKELTEATAVEGTIFSLSLRPLGIADQAPEPHLKRPLAAFFKELP
jgi:hypothetical protein